MDSDDDSDLNSLASGSSGTGSALFTPFTPLLTLKDSKSQTTLSLLSSILSTVTSLGLPHDSVDDDTSIKIGEGATYCVEKGTIGGRASLVAIKRTKFTIPKDAAEPYVEDPSLRRRIRSVLLELQVLSHTSLKNHPNFVHLLGYSWEETATGYAPAIIVDLAEFGSLDGFATCGLSWEEKRILCDDIAVGLGALHSCGIAHGDMKPDNILVFKHPERRFIAKMSDFEHALLGTDVLKYGGTPIYNAPEVHLQDHPSQQLLIPVRDFPFCDAFSFGLSVFEVFCDGKRYYENENTSSFRDLLTSFDHVKDELLGLALEFLKVQGFPPDILRVCWDIFQETLCFCPTDRLKGGWGYIRELTGAETFSVSETLTGSNEPPQSLLKHLETEYSILSLYRNIMMSSDTVRSEIAAELRYHSGQSMLPSQERAKAAFQLSICCAVGCGQLVNAQESVDWLLQAALHGHEPSLIIGARIMDANHLPIPDVLLYSPLSEETRSSMDLLEALAPEDYYSNAVRIFWGRELRNLTPKSLEVEGDVVYVSQREGFLEWFETQHISRNPTALGELIDRNFLLHHSVAIGDIEISRLLIENGGTINLVNNEGQTPLYLGCRGGYANVVKMLLSEKADPSIYDTKFITPLHWVVLFPVTEVDEISRLLVSQGANPDSAAPAKLGFYFDQLGLSLYGSPLNWACLCRNRFAVEALLSLRLDPGVPVSLDLLSNALALLSANIAEILISIGNILTTNSGEDQTRFYSMIGREMINNFQRWIIHGKDYRQEYISCVSLLLQHGVPLGGSLIDAAKELNLNLTKALITRGANPCERDPKTGHTPLHRVLMFCTDQFRIPTILEMVELLLNNGAKLEEEEPGASFQSRAPNLLRSACIWGSPVEVVRLLLSHGAHNMINSRVYSSTTLLHDSEDPRVTKLFLEFGGDPNLETLNHKILNKAREHDMAPRNCCLTAAGVALLGGFSEILEVLLDYGTTLMVGSTGDHQQTLLHLAVARYYNRIGSFNHNPKILESTASSFERFLDYPVIREEKLVSVPDWAGFTPLKYAIWFAIPRCTEILLSRGAQIDATSPEVTPRMVVDEFYHNPPYFVLDGSTDDFNTNRYSWQLHRQSKSEYRIELEKIISILDADAKKALGLVSGLTINDC